LRKRERAEGCENRGKRFRVGEKETVIYFLFDTYLVEIHEKGEGTHCWLKTNDTER
jgi:hypothetical protein